MGASEGDQEGRAIKGEGKPGGPQAIREQFKKGEASCTEQWGGWEGMLHVDLEVVGTLAGQFYGGRDAEA